MQLISKTDILNMKDLIFFVYTISCNVKLMKLVMNYTEEVGAT